MKSINSYIAGLGICLCLFLTSKPAAAQNSLWAYTGKYTMNVNGFDAYLNIYIKNNQLMVRQWWDGKTRKLEYLGNNKFIISMDGWAVKFVRNKANKVIQMEVLASEIWTRI